MTYLKAPLLSLHRSHTLEDTRVSGLSPAGDFGLAIPVRTGRRTSYWGSQLHEKGIPMLSPCGFDAVISAGQIQLILMIDYEQLRKRLAGEPSALDSLAFADHVLPANSEQCYRFGLSLGDLLDTVNRAPALLDHPVAAESLQEDVLLLVERAILAGLSKIESTPKLKVRRLALLRAQEYLRTEDSELVTVANLCVVTQSSRRTLEYAFRETLGLSVNKFLSLRRYHAARRMLRSGEDTTLSVTDVAMKNGFYNVGRFAQRYRQLFGELPSSTLQTPRQAVEPHPLVRA